jgi:hypothetical protein
VAEVGGHLERLMAQQIGRLGASWLPPIGGDGGPMFGMSSRRAKSWRADAGRLGAFFIPAAMTT